MMHNVQYNTAEYVRKHFMYVNLKPQTVHRVITDLIWTHT